MFVPLLYFCLDFLVLILYPLIEFLLVLYLHYFLSNLIQFKLQIFKIFLSYSVEDLLKISNMFANDRYKADFKGIYKVLV